MSLSPYNVLTHDLEEILTSAGFTTADIQSNGYSPLLWKLVRISNIADQWNRATDYESKQAHLERLRRALAKVGGA